MGTKEFLGQKLPYMTNPQKKYLETSKTTNISYNSFKKLLETSLENLNKPEASWTRADLIASGAQFPSTFMGKTTYIDPDNTFLVGYKAFIDLCSAYRFMAEHAQTALLYFQLAQIQKSIGPDREDALALLRQGIKGSNLPGAAFL